MGGASYSTGNFRSTAASVVSASLSGKSETLEDRVLAFIKKYGQDVHHAQMASNLGVTQKEVSETVMSLAIKGAY